MLNIGIDIQELSRFDKANDRLLKKIFTGKELRNLKNRGKHHICGLFSAKEAVIKAYNPFKKLHFKDIEVLHNKDGSPYVVMRKHKRASSKNLKISISHSKDYAVAVAVVYDVRFIV